MSLALRLKEERLAKKYSQKALSEIGGITTRSYINYEKGISVPDSKYLAKWAIAGIDIQYVVTGVRSTQALTEAEQRLINCFKRADASKKAAIMAVAESQAEELPKVAKKKPASS